MLYISKKILIPDNEIEISAIHAQGSGGQNVNKVSTAIHLRFDIKASSLPAFYKEKLLQLSDQRITKEGVIILKAQQHRTQERNKDDALLRLQELIKSVTIVPKRRRPTKPTKGAKEKRLGQKKKHSRLKDLRGKVET